MQNLHLCEYERKRYTIIYKRYYRPNYLIKKILLIFLNFNIQIIAIISLILINDFNFFQHKY